MNISLTKHYNEFVEEKVKSGRYESRSEVVRAALRLMETVEAQPPPLPYIPNLEEKLLQGLESPHRPITRALWDEIRRDVRRRVGAHKTK